MSAGEARWRVETETCDDDVFTEAGPRWWGGSLRRRAACTIIWGQGEKPDGLVQLHMQCMYHVVTDCWFLPPSVGPLRRRRLLERVRCAGVGGVVLPEKKRPEPGVARVRYRLQHLSNRHVVTRPQLGSPTRHCAPQCTIPARLGSPGTTSRRKAHTALYVSLSRAHCPAPAEPTPLLPTSTAMIFVLPRTTTHRPLPATHAQRRLTRALPKHPVYCVVTPFRATPTHKHTTNMHHFSS